MKESLPPQIKTLLLNVLKPGRYLGKEKNAVIKDPTKVDVRFALLFPDVYEVGMSHLGIQIVYEVLNSVDWIWAERAYAPWSDMRRKMIESNVPLYTLESYTPIRQLDVIGFSLQHELSFTSVLAMLELAGIPLKSEQRNQALPLIIAGGPATSNPEPLSDFVDAFILGEGEAPSIEIAKVVREFKKTFGKDSTNKDQLLKKLAEIEGVYVPALFESFGSITQGNLRIQPVSEDITTTKKAIIPDLNLSPYPAQPVVPWIEPVQNRLTVEVQRGCTRGCRFCQAGMIYRPVRQRSIEETMELIERGIAATAADTVGLLSLSIGDYRPLEALLEQIVCRFNTMDVSVSLPSLRVEALTPKIVEFLSKMRKASFTMAPEAGSERLRRVINKGNTEEDLMRSVRYVLDYGFKRIKFYFMVGLPTETHEDVEEIVSLLQRLSKLARTYKPQPKLAAAVSTFVPKAFTPFQWEGMILGKEIREKQEFLRRKLREIRVEFRYHNMDMSLLEGVFSRGDRNLGKVIQKAFEHGTYMDAWGELHDKTAWERAFEETGIDPNPYRHRKIDYEETLPWDHISYRIDKAFLIAEHKLAMMGGRREDCSYDNCYVCGVCDHKKIKREVYAFKSEKERLKPHVHKLDKERYSTKCVEPTNPINRHWTKLRLRCRYKKYGQASFLGHLETVNHILRGIRASGAIVCYSQGYHPQPKISFSQALPLGTESDCEFCEIDLCTELDERRFIHSLNRHLPPGIEFLDARRIASEEPSLGELIIGATFRFIYPSSVSVKTLHDAVERFNKAKEITVVRTKKGKKKEFNIKERTGCAKVSASNSIDVPVKYASTGAVKPAEILDALGIKVDPTLVSIRKVSVEVAKNTKNSNSQNS